TYSCDNGYAPSSAATRKCLSNGTWNGIAPNCLDMDECLGNPCDSNGDSSSGCVEDPTPGNGYTCTCSTGYASSGGSSPTCGDFNACDGTQVCTADYPCQDFAAPSLDYTCRGQFADWAPVDSPSTFTVNDHGPEDTVTDSRSDLEWQQTVDANAYTWANAKTYCSNLVYGTKSDWRLPTKAELQSIIDFTVSNPAINAAAFPSTPGTLFWSSSAYVDFASAWPVDFSSGATNGPGGPSSGRVRCVRSDAPVSASSGSGGAPPGRYTDNADGTVLDTRTGLTWQQAVPSAPAATGCSGTTCTQAGAVAYCSALSLAGTGWRLPKISELLTLVDPTQVNPATDATTFPSTPVEAFWSSSAHVGTAGYGWYVSFNDGYSSYHDVVGVTSRVRCVR
ncbi:MAG TPA: DUF1566 domain-containing protein, partial [Polyangiaceae bacterium]|nr:DUF1566 domain-containing protein [Polyangiaceae bacterium]